MTEFCPTSQDVRIIESADYLETLAGFLKPGRVLLLTSAGFTHRGLTRQMAVRLGKENLIVCDQITPNPELVDIQEWADRYRGENIATVVALGGGSTIDSGKVLSRLLATPAARISELRVTQNLSSFQATDLVAVPTTAGTGAEVTPFATVWERSVGKKYSFQEVAPDIAILDAGLTLSLPRRETLYSALDALSHALESLWNKNRTPASAQDAERAIMDICQALPKVLASPGDFSGRQQLQRAATRAGLAIAQTRTALAHAMSYPLTLRYGIPHGLACSFTLAAIIRAFEPGKLNLPGDLVDKILDLLDSLRLHEEIESYVAWPTLVEQFDAELDPSRAGNFIEPVSRELLAGLLSSSAAAVTGTRNG
jgi:alcohol dehydrogenase